LHERAAARLSPRLPGVQWRVAKVTSEQARAYLARWELVRGAEAAEVRLTSMETKLVQLAALMAARDTFGPEPDRDVQIREVRERWARLRQSLNG
jgi:hypothetical protein